MCGAILQRGGNGRTDRGDSLFHKLLRQRRDPADSRRMGRTDGIRADKASRIRAFDHRPTCGGRGRQGEEHQDDQHHQEGPHGRGKVQRGRGVRFGEDRGAALQPAASRTGGRVVLRVPEAPGGQSAPGRGVRPVQEMLGDREPELRRLAEEELQRLRSEVPRVEIDTPAKRERAAKPGSSGELHRSLPRTSRWRCRLPSSRWSS